MIKCCVLLLLIPFAKHQVRRSRPQRKTAIRIHALP